MNQEALRLAEQLQTPRCSIGPERPVAAGCRGWTYRKPPALRSTSRAERGGGDDNGS